LRALSQKPTAGKERPQFAAREQVFEKQIESIDQRIQEIGKEQQSTKERSVKINRDSIYTANTSTRVKEDRWDWAVFIVGDNSTLKEIKCVEYTLHPTFPNPVHKICTKGSTSGKGFFLSSSGWGTFIIKVKIMFKDGDVREFKHQLRFS
jgi:transcription initiation factor IIF auxiliary subunit